MNSREFVDSIKLVVRDASINDTISILTNPPGRKVSSKLRARSDWFNAQSEQEQRFLRETIADAVDNAIFGVFCVLDGVRAVEDSATKGKFELRFVKEASILLNPTDAVMLHELYNAQD